MFYLLDIIKTFFLRNYLNENNIFFYLDNNIKIYLMFIIKNVLSVNINKLLLSWILLFIILDSLYFFFLERRDFLNI